MYIHSYYCPCQAILGVVGGLHTPGPPWAPVDRDPTPSHPEALVDPTPSPWVIYKPCVINTFCVINTCRVTNELTFQTFTSKRFDAQRFDSADDLSCCGRWS